MYMNPTFPVGGVLWFIQASAHAPALASMHIGSGPGVPGLSGMHVQPFVPLRIVTILPSAVMLTIAAFFATLIGAALMALLMRSASLGAALGLSAANAASATVAQIRTPVTFFIAQLLLRFIFR